jgi:hypothetical protein
MSPIELDGPQLVRRLKIDRPPLVHCAAIHRPAHKDSVTPRIASYLLETKFPIKLVSTRIPTSIQHQQLAAVRLKLVTGA